MKKMMFTMVLMVTIVTSASAMTFNEAREHAMFLTDKMSYELGLSPTQLNNVYEINLDFVMAAAIRGERLSTCLSRRDTDLRYVLSDYQYRIYKKTSYFNRPMSYSRQVWTFSIYNYYTDRNHMYTKRPNSYKNYQGAGNPRKSYSPPARPLAGKEMRKQQRINPHSNSGRK